MRKEDLLHLIGSVDDRYIEELYEEDRVSVSSIKRRRSGIRAIAASLALIVLGSAAMIHSVGRPGSGEIELNSHGLSLGLAQNSIVMLDVNPSIRMEVNDRGVVVEVDATNDDADKLMDELNIVGIGCEEAVTKAVSVLQEHQYITNLKNSILVSVLDKNGDAADTLRQKLIDAIQKADENEQAYSFSILSQVLTDESDICELAEKFSTSTGKARLIQTFCEQHSGYKFENIIENNIQTINQLFEYIGLPDGVFKTGTAAATVPSEYRDQLELTSLSEDDMLDFVSAIADFYNKLCSYYNEGDVATQAGYAFSIAEGQSQDGVRSWAVFAESLTKNVANRGTIISAGDSSVDELEHYEALWELTKFIIDVAN